MPLCEIGTELVLTRALFSQRQLIERIDLLALQLDNREQAP